VDISKHQQFSQWSDADENSTKTITTAQVFTLMASATTLAPSALRTFDERFSDVNALLSEKILAISVVGYQG
jgi:hypothetical protein